MQWKKSALLSCVIGGGIFAALSVYNLEPIPETFHAILSSSQHVQFLDRNGEPLSTTYQSNWNIHDTVTLQEIPDFLKTAFIFSEDKRYYHHSGVDWLARIAALITNIKAQRAVRGASTITEQTVRMIHPRPRVLWSRWLEGIEAMQLQRHFTKDQILEFYLNQVPYAANRRGVVQAANYYFNRDLDTLSKKEMLALVTLIRAPSRLDLWKNKKALEHSISRLSDRLVEENILGQQEKEQILSASFQLETRDLAVNATEFIRHVKRQPLLRLAGWPHVKTTLDSTLQARVQTMLDESLRHLAYRQVHNGAVLIVNHGTGEILAWVVAGKNAGNTPGRYIDAVSTPRQPGSALKPLLYLLALEKGWSAATLIHDAALGVPVGNGLYAYRNYSNRFYGKVTVREALGNSLNIPAVKTLLFVGAENYLNFLDNLGFSGFTHHPDFYGAGIALGSAEVTLYELVQAFTAIANQGVFQPLTVFSDGLSVSAPYRVAPPEITSLISDILSDPQARKLEFGEHSLLNFPIQTAIKTGTSTDHRDSWAVGFNFRYTVGIWMGNLDQLPTDGITGATGPVLLLRSIFSELNKRQETKALPIHKRLVKQDVCVNTLQLKTMDHACESYSEWFVPGTEPVANMPATRPEFPIKLTRPTPGLQIAIDPRLPEQAQAFEFHIQGISDNEIVRWKIDNSEIVMSGNKYYWPLQKGNHDVQATVWSGEQLIAEIEKTPFMVK